MQGARGKLKQQLRLPMSGSQPQKSSFWWWGESPAHVVYQLSLSGTERIWPHTGWPGAVWVGAGVGCVGGTGHWQGHI